jgi:VanZ family protein
MNPRASLLLRSLPALAWMGMIFYMSSQPGGESGAFSRLVLEWFAGIGLDLRVLFGEHAFWVIRKMAHFTEYAILFLLIHFAIGTSMAWPRRPWVALLLVFLYACSDEFHQLFIPKRVGDIADVMIDTLGGAFALSMVFLVRMLRRKRLRPMATR